MVVKIKWHAQINLGTKATFAGQAKSMSLSKIPDKPGIYVFARKFGSSLIPIYIGKASNLRSRLKVQFNNHNLMEALRNEKSGDRVLLCGSITSGSQDLLKKKLQLAERTHIAHSLTANHPLINIQLTKGPVNVVGIDGPKPQTHPFPKTMLSKA